MVWMTLTGAATGQSLYLEIEKIEQSGKVGAGGFAIQATLGDGSRETAVLLECGMSVAITFVDEWLDIDRFRSFLAAYDRGELEDLLRETVRDCDPRQLGVAAAGTETNTADSDDYVSAHDGEPGRQMHLPLVVAEAAPTWSLVA